VTWLTDAACAGMPVDWWFSRIPSYESRARWLCGECPCTDACLAEALEQGDKFSIRAGTTPWQRRVMRREMAA
jgi:hypothetical protein